mmetsp:Transcript_20034/g.30133  ORF Transcript_20034/g.30133 Transcript_20034/m.30133 type:complete len:765 (+) Transcript_20034:90-2384(+)
MSNEASIIEAYERWSVKDDSAVDYGHFSKSGGSGISEETSKDAFYLTTAINYTNGPAHMGHAYEATTSDAIVRYARLKGKGPVFFLTGADEHGQKIANTAADQGKQPIEICNKFVTGFKSLNQRILVTNDDYVRTTSSRHKRTAQELWKRCAENGDIYLDTYSGWYNIREETFVTESDAAISDYKDATSGQPLKRVEEESYFFKMSAYQSRLIEHIEQNPEFIRPEQHRNLILSRLWDDDLRDLSISRTTFSWGISLSAGFNDNHVMYVWIDALSNYLTGVNGLGTDGGDGAPNLDKFWPANVHIIGKDILWFHTVIWPTLLMSAKMPLPKTVFAHGFVNDHEGKKMSKSLGNVVDPHDMLDKYPVDTFRWYLCKEAPYGGELSFSEQSLRIMHNADLCDTLGNLVHRATKLCEKYCGGHIPDVPPPEKSPINLKEMLSLFITKMDNFELEGGSNIAIGGFRDINGYLTAEAPWLKKGDEHAEFRKIVVRATLEAIFALTHLLTPFIPNGAAMIFRKLNVQPLSLNEIKVDCRNLEVGTKVDVGDVLYSKLMSDDEKLSAAEAAKKNKESYEEAQRRKKEKKAKNIAASKAGQQANAANQPEFTKIDIRVGKIVKVWNHQEADKLFCEEIDLGEESGPRQIASGLREQYTLEQLQDRKVLVVCNLKSAKIVGFLSNGMVLAAKQGDKVELVEPPNDASIGERVFISGLEGDPVSSTQVKKRKIWDKVSDGLKTNDKGVATWNGHALLTHAGSCSAESLADAPIS